MVTKEAFHHFKEINDFNCSWIVEDDFYKTEIEPEIKKIKQTRLRAEFMYKCLYLGEKPLSKKDYGRTRYTANLLWQKASSLCNVKTKSEDEAFQKGMRRLQIEKGLYPFKSNGKTIDERIEDNPELKKYYETGRYTRGGFVDKYIADIHRF